MWYGFFRKKYAWIKGDKRTGITTESKDASEATRASRRSHILKRISNSAEIYKGETALRILAVLPCPSIGIIFWMTCKASTLTSITKRVSVLMQKLSCQKGKGWKENKCGYTLFSHQNFEFYFPRTEAICPQTALPTLPRWCTWAKILKFLLLSHQEIWSAFCPRKKRAKH